MRRPLVAFLRASSLHIGAAAATAALREELAREHNVPPSEIDQAYAVSRITPGTNLLALYALLGHRLGGWRLAIQAVIVGSLLPAAIVIAVAAYAEASRSTVVGALMAGARAGGIAVFLGAAFRLLKPQLRAHPRSGVAFVIVVGVVAVVWSGHVFGVLLPAGAIGALLFRPR